MTIVKMDMDMDMAPAEMPEHDGATHKDGPVAGCEACECGCTCDGMVFVHHDLDDDVCDACVERYFEIYPDEHDDF